MEAAAELPLTKCGKATTTAASRCLSPPPQTPNLPSPPPFQTCAAGVYDSLFQRLAKAEASAHEGRSDRRGKRPPGPFTRFGAPPAPSVAAAAVAANAIGALHC